MPFAKIKNHFFKKISESLEEEKLDSLVRRARKKEKVIKP